MFTSRSLPWFELARLTRARRTRIALLTVMVVPLLAGLLQTLTDAGDDVSTVRAAIVNNDEIVTTKDLKGNEMPVAVGRLLAGQLAGDTSADNFDWVITHSKDAASGLKDGTYGAVLTIPKNLSASAISTAGKNPEQGTLGIETNDTTSYLNGQIARVVGKATTSTLNGFVTETYLDNLYVGFGTIKSSVGKAADGAGKLDDGAQQLSDGLALLKQKTATFPGDAKKLDSGVAQLDDGVRQLDSGVAELKDGSAQLKSGSAQLASGMDQLVAKCPALILFQAYCDGVAQARDGAKQLAGGTAELDGGIGTLKGGTSELADGTGQLHDGTRQLADQAPKLANAISQASVGASQLAGGSGKLADGLKAGADQVPSYSAGDRAQLSKVVATPVTAKAEKINAVESATRARIPFVLAVALFLGALATFILLTPLAARALAAALPGWRATFAGYLPALLLAGGQVAALLGVFALTDRLGVERPVQFTVVAFVAAWTFTAVVQALVALFGRGGIFAGAAWLFVQASMSDPSQPAGSLPSLLDALRTLSPLNPAIEGLRGAQTGGAGITAPIITLMVWLVLGLIATSIAAYRERTVTVTQVQLSAA